MFGQGLVVVFWYAFLRHCLTRTIILYWVAACTAIALSSITPLKAKEPLEASIYDESNVKIEFSSDRKSKNSKLSQSNVLVAEKLNQNEQNLGFYKNRVQELERRLQRIEKLVEAQQKIIDTKQNNPPSEVSSPEADDIFSKLKNASEDEVDTTQIYQGVPGSKLPLVNKVKVEEPETKKQEQPEKQLTQKEIEKLKQEERKNRQNGNPTGLADEKDKEDYLELQQVRDKAVTLSVGQSEVSFAFDYLRHNNVFQSDTIFVGKATYRYGLAKGTEVGITLPAYYGLRETQIPTGLLSEETIDFGDLALQLNYTLKQETNTMPGVVVSGLAGIPLGEDPYSHANPPEPGRNPTEAFKIFQTSGHYSVGGNIQFFKNFDPVSLYAGIGAQYYFSKDVAGVEVQPSPQINYNMGFGFSISPHTSISALVSGAYQGNLNVDGVEVDGFDKKPVSLRLSLGHRLDSKRTIQPSVSFGLTDDTVDSVFGLEYRQKLE